MKREATRKICALKYLAGYPDAKVIDPIKDNYPACTMPLASTAPVHVTPEIMRNTQYAEEYIAHVALVRELLDQASLSTNSSLLMRSNNQLLRSLGGLLKGASTCERVEHGQDGSTKPDAELVRQTTALMGSADNISINMPGAPMPLPGGDAPALIHPCLVTSLTGNQPYYRKGGLIPHLTKKVCFWKSTPPPIHLTVLKDRLHIDPVNSDYLNQIEKIDCGWTAPLPRAHHYDGATGLHLSLGPDCALKDVQYWVKQNGTTAKAASPALPPMPWSNSVQGLTHHFEQVTMRSAVPPMHMGHLPDEATAEVSKISLNRS